jgi:hypothetical protein
VKTVLIAIGAAALAAAAVPAGAHHSSAMFDGAKQITLQGTIKEFQFTNPHSWIQLNVVDPAGKVTEWSLETNGVSQLFKRGWRSQTLKPGDKVTISVHPLKNGNSGGAVMSVLDAGGKKVGSGGGE